MMIKKCTSILFLFVLFSSYLSAQTVTATQTDSLVGDHQAIGVANPNDTIRYKTKISVSGANANAVNFSNMIPANTTFVAGSLKTSALSRDDNFATSFNTLLNTGNVITNDFGLPSVVVVSFGTTASNGTTTMAGNPGTTNGGGTLTVNADGTFSYQPLPGYTGMDQFTYISTTGVPGAQNGSGIVTIDVAPDIIFSTMDVNPICNGTSTGSITFSAMGGSGTLMYSITGIMGSFQPSPVFSGLAAGTYNLAVKDAVGYTQTGMTTLSQPSAISFTTTDVNNICNGAMAGSITFNASGGTGVLTYSINGSMGSYQVGAAYTGLFSDFYSLAVKDANNCIAIGSTTITEPAAVTFTFTKTDITCFGAMDGTITFNAPAGGNPPYMYAIDGLMGMFSSNTNYTNLAAGNYNLVVKDNNGCNAMEQVTTVIEPAVIVVSGAIINQVYNTAMGNVTFTKTGGSGSPANPWSASGLPTGININSMTGVVSGTPTQTGSFNATITYTDANGCTDNQQTSFTVAPNLANNAYNVVGNTQLVANGHSTPTTPHTTNATNILGNDQADVTIVITAVTDAATTGGGLISITADGKFIYTPVTGSTSADSYVYTGTANGISATATINFTVSNMVWYVNNTFGGASDGRSHAPFMESAAAASAAAINQVIYVHTGMGNTPGNLVLKSGQTLRGAGNALTLGALSIPAGTKPTLSGTVTLANSVIVDGFDMNTGSITALSSSGATSVNVSIGNVTTSGAATAVTLTGTTGSISIAGGSLTGGAGTLFNVNGGSATISCAASLTQSTASQRIANITAITGGSVTLSGNLSGSGSSTGINVSSNTGGTITFSGGSKSLNTGSNAAVTLSSNSGATVNFSGGGLVINTTSGIGFDATGGGTINVTGTGNTIASISNTALNVSATTIGGSNLNFLSISAGNNNASPEPTNGIVLNNSGSGGLTISGDGGGSNNNSGGIIQNTTSHGVSLTTVSNVRLNYMGITNNLGSGISGSAINGFQMNRTTITGNGNDAASDESGINVTQLTGTAFGGANPTSITNCTISNNNEFELQITNTSGTLTDLQMSGNTLSSDGLPINGNGSSPHGNLVNFLALGTANMTANVTSGSFIGNWNPATPPSTITATAMQCDHSGTSGTMTANISNATFTNNNVGPQASVAGGGRVVFNFSNNTVTGSRSTAINFFADANPPFTKSLEGKVMNNTIGIAGVTNSGAQLGIGIRIQNEGAVPITMQITGNTIQEVQSFQGINVNVGLGGIATGGQMTNLTITNNTIRKMNGSRAIAIQDNQTTPNTPAPTICANISGNIMSDVFGQAGDGTYVRIRRLNGIFNVTQASLAALEAANTCQGGSCAGLFAPSGTITYGQPACTLPIN